MPKQLAAPVPFSTPFGSGNATHEFHNVQIVDRESDCRIISTKSLAVEFDGGLREIPGKQTSIDIVGDDLSDLGQDFTLADISAKHDEIWARQAATREDALAAEAERLQKEIEATEARLATLRAAK